MDLGQVEDAAAGEFFGGDVSGEVQFNVGRREGYIRSSSENVVDVVLAGCTVEVEGHVLRWVVHVAVFGFQRVIFENARAFCVDTFGQGFAVESGLNSLNSVLREYPVMCVTHPDRDTMTASNSFPPTTAMLSRSSLFCVVNVNISSGCAVFASLYFASDSGSMSADRIS